MAAMVILRATAVPRAAAARRAPVSLLGGARRAQRTLATGEDFFNREIEIREFHSILDNEPQITVVLGGPSTGKSRLLTHILRDPAGHYAPVHINLRGIAIQDYQQLGEQLMSKVSAWATPASPLHKLLEAGKVIAGGASISVPGIAEVILPNWNQSSERTLEDFTNTLDLLKTALPIWRLRTGTQRKPVLFIDEANLLGGISKKPDDDGAVALRSLLRWCVLNTKEEGRFHVVFASSDSFFVDWLGAQGITPHVRPLVVGDLDREHAQAYYEHRLDMANVPSDIAVPSFDEVYRVCGGHMLSIRMYVREAVLAATTSRQQEFVFSGLQDARTRLGLMVPHGSKSSKSWSRRQVLDMFTVIHRDGWLVHADAENLIGETVTKALIDADVVHFRPKRPIVADLPKQPEEAVLTARTPVERVAMGLIVSKEQGRSRKPNGSSFG
jgi:hypothetical protein